MILLYYIFYELLDKIEFCKEFVQFYFVYFWQKVPFTNVLGKCHNFMS